jgi:hypothetical protein
MEDSTARQADMTAAAKTALQQGKPAEPSYRARKEGAKERNKEPREPSANKATEAATSSSVKSHVANLALVRSNIRHTVHHLTPAEPLNATAFEFIQHSNNTVSTTRCAKRPLMLSQACEQQLACATYCHKLSTVRSFHWWVDFAQAKNWQHPGCYNTPGLQWEFGL